MDHPEMLVSQRYFSQVDGMASGTHQAVWRFNMLKISIFLAAMFVAGSSQGAPHFAIEDSTGNSCVSAEAGFETAVFQIVTYYDGIPDAGGGFEFRITGMPVDWVVSTTPNPASNVSIGAPFGAGAHIGFPICEPGQDQRVVLYDVVVFPTSSVTATLQLEAHSSPSNPSFACPLMTACFAFTSHCFPTEVIGSIHGSGAPCTIGVEKGTWGSVKSLFQ